MTITNEDRAEYAGNAITEYLSSKGEQWDNTGPERECEISDLMCDLMHLADRHGFDAWRITERAIWHHYEECLEEAPVPPAHGSRPPPDPDLQRVTDAWGVFIQYVAERARREGEPLMPNAKMTAQLLRDLRHFCYKNQKSGFDFDQACRESLKLFLTDLGWTKGGGQ